MIPRRFFCAQSRWVFLLILNLILDLVFCFVIFPSLMSDTTGLYPDGYGSAGRVLHCRSWALALLAPIAGIMGVSVLVFAFARLSATIMPYVIGLAAYGLWPIVERSRRTS